MQEVGIHSLSVPWASRGLFQALVCTCQGRWCREGAMWDTLKGIFSPCGCTGLELLSSPIERGEDTDTRIICTSFPVCCLWIRISYVEEAIKRLSLQSVCSFIINKSFCHLYKALREKTDIHTDKQNSSDLYNQGWLYLTSSFCVQHEKIRPMSHIADSALKRFISAQVCFT